MIGAVVGLLLPETLGAILPETIEDGENFGKDQSFWDFPCCQRPKEYEQKLNNCSVFSQYKQRCVLIITGSKRPAGLAPKFQLRPKWRPLGPIRCGLPSAERRSARVCSPVKGDKKTKTAKGLTDPSKDLYQLPTLLKMFRIESKKKTKPKEGSCFVKTKLYIFIFHREIQAP